MARHWLLRARPAWYDHGTSWWRARLPAAVGSGHWLRSYPSWHQLHTSIVSVSTNASSKRAGAIRPAFLFGKTVASSVKIIRLGPSVLTISHPADIERKAWLWRWSLVYRRGNRS